jgi:hypothetical protein
VWNADLLYYLLIVWREREFAAINSDRKRGICIQISAISKKFSASPRDNLFYVIIIVIIVTNMYIAYFIHFSIAMNLPRTQKTLNFHIHGGL